MKYTLIAEDTWNGSKTTREFEVDGLPEVLSEVELFLKGVGFVFDGTLDFVNDFEDTPNWDDEDFQEMDYDAPHIGEMSDSMNLPSNNWPFSGAGSNVESGGAGNIHSQHYCDTERNK
jgi:hypothetical protein